MRQIFLGIATLTVLGFAAPSDASTVNFIVSLSGAQEVGGGDPDGSGTAYLSIDDVANTIDWNIVVSNIALPLPPSGAHIHNADKRLLLAADPGKRRSIRPHVPPPRYEDRLGARLRTEALEDRLDMLTNGLRREE